MREVTNIDTFKEIIHTHGVVFLDVYATWCGPCKKIAPEFEALSRQYSSSLFVKTNCAESQDIAHSLSISSIPTFVVFVNGEEAGRISGGNTEQLRNFVAEHAL